MLPIGTKAPDFSLADQHDKKHSLTEYLGKKIIIYFYPKNDTPGCTTEACNFRDNYEELQKKAIILGISSDSTTSHKTFAEKYQLPFILLSDPEKEVIKKYKADGIFTKRITYLIDPQGNIAKIYPNVSPSGHVHELLKDL